MSAAAAIAIAALALALAGVAAALVWACVRFVSQAQGIAAQDARAARRQPRHIELPTTAEDAGAETTTPPTRRAPRRPPTLSIAREPAVEHPEPPPSVSWEEVEAVGARTRRAPEPIAEVDGA